MPLVDSWGTKHTVVHFKKNEARKTPSYFPFYWLVNRDPYNGLS